MLIRSASMALLATVGLTGCVVSAQPSYYPGYERPTVVITRPYCPPPRPYYYGYVVPSPYYYGDDDDHHHGRGHRGYH